MKNEKTGSITRHKSPAGFSLVELTVAMAIFMVVGGAAVALVKMHIPLFTSQQNQTGLNLSMRNGVAQMQIDVVNAGTGYYQGVNIPSWPIGLTVANSAAGTGCYDAVAKSYGPGCFDTLNVISMDVNTPPSNPSDVVLPSAPCADTSLSPNIYLTPIGATTVAQLALDYKQGDQILLLKSDGSQMGTTKLLADGVVSGGKVLLTHNVTNADGTNSLANDPLQITNSADSKKLGVSFCGTDWVMKISPITYTVDASDPTDPKLTRKQAGVTNVIAEQIIGFKVGAAIWNGVTDGTYNFDASTYVPPYDWSLIRAVRVSMIGRTPADITNNFHNSFDGGAYKIESVSVVINPRNLSMND